MPELATTLDMLLSVSFWFLTVEKLFIYFLISVLFPRHTNKETRANTINLIHMFRDYLHYHIKVGWIFEKIPNLHKIFFQCSKAYIHSRMRAKTSDFLKVLNRARPENKTVEKKTITWVLNENILKFRYLLFFFSAAKHFSEGSNLTKSTFYKKQCILICIFFLFTIKII